MILPTEIHTHEIPRVLDRFSELVGPRNWVRRAQAVRSEAKGHPYLREFLFEENSIALQLDAITALIEKYGAIPPAELTNRERYGAYKLAAQIAAITASADKDEGRKIIRRLHGALNNPDDMRALQFELGVATHFARRGYSLTAPESEGTGTFDLLVHGVGRDGLEIECKSVSVNRGRKIHRRDALEFHELVRKRLEPLAHRLNSGLSVVLTVPDRLPRSYSDRKALADQVARAVMSGKSQMLGGGEDLRISEFDVTLHPKLAPPMTPELRRNIDQITGTNNREAMLLGKRSAGALVFVVQSAKDDPFFDHIFNSIEEAARCQLTGARGGVVLVGFDGMTAAEMLSIGQQDEDSSKAPTALRKAVSHFLTRTTKPHLVGVGFLSRDELSPKVGNVVSTGGVAYHFPRRESALWHDDFGGLFEGEIDD